MTLLSLLKTTKVKSTITFLLVPIQCTGLNLPNLLLMTSSSLPPPGWSSFTLQCLLVNFFLLSTPLTCKIQLITEQQKFELHRSTYAWIIFTKYIVQCYMILLLNLWTWSHGYEWLTEKVPMDFWLCGGLVPHMFKDQLYFQTFL